MLLYNRWLSVAELVRENRQVHVPRNAGSMWRAGHLHLGQPATVGPKADIRDSEFDSRSGVLAHRVGRCLDG